jgi:hypothetical protein
MAIREDSAKTPTDIKRFGRYYTPETIAQAMVDWAIRDSKCTVLDPSFGGCAFFRTSVTALRRLGAERPGRLLYGVDIDPDARGYLSPLLDSGAKPHQFRTEDFLKTKPCQMSDAPYSVVVGNPPYVRHHDVDNKFDIRETLGLDNGTSLSARASYWAYFVLHSLGFIARDGRLAMVLPGAFLHADYAATVRGKLEKSFARLTIILVQERLFEDAEENSVLVLAEGYGREHQGVRLATANSAQDVKPICDSINTHTKPVSGTKSGQQLLSALISKAALGAYEELRMDPRIISLDACAAVRIGTVTGANAVFVINEVESLRLHVPKRSLRPIVKRATFLQGLTFRRADYGKLLRAGQAALLLKLESGKDVSPHLANYLRSAKTEGVHERYKCSIRKKWYRLDEPHKPDAFLQYMSADTPRLVLNDAKVSCTNAIHELTWKRKMPLAERRFLTMSSLSVLFRLSAELEGRSYGGGVLKVEPSEAKHLLLVSAASEETTLVARFAEIDHLLRVGSKPEAAELVDRLLLQDGLRLPKATVEEMNGACEFLKGLRLPRDSSRSLSKIA